MKVNGDGSLMLFLLPLPGSVSVCVCVFVYAQRVESPLKDEEHCLRRTLVMLCAVFVDFSHFLKLPMLFQPN